MEQSKDGSEQSKDGSETATSISLGRVVIASTHIQLVLAMFL